MHVALHAAQLSALLFRPAHAVGFVRKVQQQAADGDEALAHLRSEIAFAADGAQDLVIASGAIGALLRLEDIVRDLVDLRAHALQDVGGAIDDRIQEVHEHRFSVHCRRAYPGELVADHHERTRLVVAHRDQPVSGEDESDRGRFRRLGVGLTHQRCGHVARPILHIETTGDLDLLHLLAGRHGDADLLLHELVFLQIGIDQVEPHRAFGRVAPGLDRDPVKRGAARNVDPQHDPSAAICLTGQFDRIAAISLSSAPQCLSLYNPFAVVMSRGW